MYVTIAVSLVFGVLYVVCILMFFGQAGIMVAGYNFEPTAPEAKKLHKRIMRRFGLGIFVVCLLMHGTVVAFLYAGNVAGGVLAGVSVAVLVAVIGIFLVIEEGGLLAGILMIVFGVILFQEAITGHIVLGIAFILVAVTLTLMGDGLRSRGLRGRLLAWRIHRARRRRVAA